MAKRVLSIQSHVVSGYVGNKSATFPLQVLGFDVDAINSVQLSNHTGYKCFQGQVLNSDELKVLFEGLKKNDIHHYSHLLTGYVGSESFLREVLNVVKELKQSNPEMIYVCDPVMGDNGKFYVPECLMPIYRDELVPLADVVTPNQFEVELMAGIPVKTEEDAVKAINILQSKGCGTVVITSSWFDADYLVLLGKKKGSAPNEYIRLQIPRLDAIFTGTGDLFASMLLAWLHRHPNDLKLACEKTMSAVQQILKKTLNEAKELAGDGNTPTAGQIELRLVQSLDLIRDPEILFTADVAQLKS